jgi:hypothetical protein
MSSNQTISGAKDLEYKKEFTKEEALNKAFYNAINYGVGGLAVGVGASLGLTRTKLRPFMSTSAKFAIPLMVGIFSFSVAYEHNIYDAMHNPAKWGLTYQFTPDPHDDRLGEQKIRDQKRYKPLPFYKEAANYLNENPITIVAATGIPLAAAVLYKNLQAKDLAVQQRILNSRIIAQGGVITILLSVMGFKAFMDQHGGKFLPEEDE